mmetsp:Transcript_28742/g.89693  ORF Transcript_28742/g.89693 Transcript_28742/m.89693 type:complete len:200 (+) Transcript_28742:76-675(+)
MTTPAAALLAMPTRATLDGRAAAPPRPLAGGRLPLPRPATCRPWRRGRPPRGRRARWQLPRERYSAVGRTPGRWSLPGRRVQGRESRRRRMRGLPLSLPGLPASVSASTLGWTRGTRPARPTRRRRPTAIAPEPGSAPSLPGCRRWRRCRRCCASCRGFAGVCPPCSPRNWWRSSPPPRASASTTASFLRSSCRSSARG